MNRKMFWEKNKIYIYIFTISVHLAAINKSFLFIQLKYFVKLVKKKVNNNFFGYFYKLNVKRLKFFKHII